MKYYYHFVVNPEAGSGRGLKVAKKLKQSSRSGVFPISSTIQNMPGKNRNLLLLYWHKYCCHGMTSIEKIQKCFTLTGGDRWRWHLTSSSFLLQESEKIFH